MTSKASKWSAYLGGLFVVIGLTALPIMRAHGQTVVSIPTALPKRVTVVPGERYRAGWFKRFWLGSDYRKLWTTPVQADVLDLNAVGGGLTPLRTGGSGQSRSLHFRGNDGRRYVVRSVDKDPTQRLLPDLRGTFVESIVQDQISSLHPFAALVVDPLLEATDVLHATHKLVVIPDDTRLGKFRDEFAGMLGMLVERPDEGPNASRGFAGSTRIVGSERLLELVRSSSCDRVDARALLKARLIDLVIGDKDRHPEQWRWASFPRGSCRTWLPIPEDRDQAFINLDGLLMAATRIVGPQQIRFGPKYPSTVGLTFKGWDVDRGFLAELERPTWDSLVQVVQHALTDAVIESAVRSLPPQHYQLSGEFLASALKARRDHLSKVATKYYRLINRWVDVNATDRSEIAEIQHLPNGDLDVTIGVAEERPGQRTPYFRRRFSARETKEVRIYLHDGDDHARVFGQKGHITVRVIGGPGNDRFVNTSWTGAKGTRFYDANGDNVFVTGRGARINRDAYERPASSDRAHKYALDWGGRNITAPFFTYDPDLGLFFGGYHNVKRFGFRKDPYTAQHVVRGGFATAEAEPHLSYDGRYRGIAKSVDGMLRVRASGINILRFYGFGNETASPSPSSFFKVEQRQLTVEPLIGFVPSQSFELAIGPVFKLIDTDLGENADRFIAVSPPYGTELFGQFGAQAGISWDTRDMPGHPRSGLHVTANAAVYPSILDIDSVFGEVNGTASTYLSVDIPTEPTLALRVGGKKVWGGFPYYEAAYIGGGETLRGFRSQRFAGDASVYGNAELRLYLAKLKLLFPGRFGVFGFSDIGRVFFDDDPDDADSWHNGYGGGVWMSFLRQRHTLSVAIADGDDLTGVYVRAGFLF